MNQKPYHYSPHCTFCITPLQDPCHLPALTVYAVKTITHYNYIMKHKIFLYEGNRYAPLDQSKEFVVYLKVYHLQSVMT